MRPRGKGGRELLARSVLHLEIVGAGLGLLILVGAGIFLYGSAYAPAGLLAALCLGGVMNFILALLQLERQRYLLCALPAAVGALLTAVFIIQIIGGI